MSPDIIVEGMYRYKEIGPPGQLLSLVRVTSWLSVAEPHRAVEYAHKETFGNTKRASCFCVDLGDDNGMASVEWALQNQDRVGIWPSGKGSVGEVLVSKNEYKGHPRGYYLFVQYFKDEKSKEYQCSVSRERNYPDNETTTFTGTAGFEGNFWLLTKEGLKFFNQNIFMTFNSIDKQNSLVLIPVLPINRSIEPRTVLPPDCIFCSGKRQASDRLTGVIITTESVLDNLAVDSPFTGRQLVAKLLSDHSLLPLP